MTPGVSPREFLPGSQTTASWITPTTSRLQLSSAHLSFPRHPTPGLTFPMMTEVGGIHSPGKEPLPPNARRPAPRSEQDDHTHHTLQATKSQTTHRRSLQACFLSLSKHAPRTLASSPRPEPRHSPSFSCLQAQRKRKSARYLCGLHLQPPDSWEQVFGQKIH